MRRISLNLARQPFYNVTLYGSAYAVSGALVLGMTGLNLYTFIADRAAAAGTSQARAEVTAEMEGLDRQEERHRRELSKISLPRLGTRSRFAHDAILQREFSWTHLFNRLEQLQPHNVKLRAIRPAVEADAIRIRVAGVAQDPEAFAQFQENLLHSPLFSEVYPSSETWSEEQRGLAFDLAFRYVPEPEAAAGGGGAVASAPAGDLPAPPAAAENGLLAAGGAP